MVKTLPDIIKAAAASNLGILALIIISAGLLAFFLFRNTPVKARLIVYLCCFAGLLVFGIGALTAQRRQVQDEMAREAQRIRLEERGRIQGLRLRLVFPKTDQARPYTATVSTYLQTKDEPSEKLRDELVQVLRGAGGLALDFKHLDNGDRLFVVVRDGKKMWRSDDVKIPEANLEMTLVEDESGRP